MKERKHGRSLRHLEPSEQQALEPKTDKGHKSRRLLQDAAREVFREVGFSGARVTDMSSKAGMSNGAFYRYFLDKDDMLRSLLEEFFDELYEFTRVSWEPGEPQRSVQMTTARYLQQYRQNADLYRVMIEAAQTEEDIEEVWNDARQAFFQRISRNLSRTKKEGAIREEIDPDLAAALLGGMAEHFAYLWFVLGREPDRSIEEVSAQIAAIWSGGVSSTAPNPAG